MVRRLLFVFLILPLLSHAQPQTNASEANRLFERAVARFEEGHYREAIPLMEQVLEIRENAANKAPLDVAAALHELGRFYTAMIYSEKAESALVRALELREQQLGSDHPETGKTIGLLADYYRKIGKMKEAEPLFARSIEILEKAGGPDNPDLVSILSNLSRFYKDSGNYADAEAKSIKAIAIAEKTWGSDAAEVAIPVRALGDIYALQGKQEEAEALYQRSLAIQEKTIGAEHPEMCSTKNSLALLYDAAARYAEAEELQKQVLNCNENGLGPDHPHVAASLNNLAVLYYRQGRFSEAAPLFRKASEIEEKVFGPDHYHVITDLSNLATTYTVLGRYTDAEPLLKRVLESRRKNPASAELGTALNNLAKHYRETGRYGEAESLYKEAAQVWEEGLGEEHPLVALAFGNLGVLYHTTNRYPEAEQSLQRSRTLYEKAVGEEHPDTAQVLFHLANLYRDLKRYEESERLFLKAQAVLEKSIGTENPRVAAVWNGLGNLYRASRKTDQAEIVLQKALDVRKQSLGENHPSVAETMISLASVQSSMGRHQRANALFVKGTMIQQNLRENIFSLLSERQKLTFAEIQALPVHVFLEHTVRFLTQDSKSVEASLSAWLAWKGAVQEAQGRYLDALILSEDAQVREKWEELQSTRRQIARMWLVGPGRLKTETYRQRLTDLSEMQDRLEADLSSLSQAYAQERKTGGVSMNRVAGLLPEGGVYLDYARITFYDSLTGQHMSPHYLVFALTGGKNPVVHLFDLGSAREIDSLISAYRKEISSIVEKGRPDRQQTRQMSKYGKELYRRLILPLESKLKNRKELVISPDGLMNILPLEVLLSEQNEYLLQKYDITYLGSGRDIFRWTERKAGGNAIVMADPDFDLTLMEHAAVLSDLGMKTDPLRSGTSGAFRDWSFSRLPDSRKEGQEVARLIKEKMNIPVQLYLDQQAVEEILLTLRSPEVLHVATHGYFIEEDTGGNQRSHSLLEDGIPEANWENPALRSGIALSGANQSLKNGRDGGLVSAIKIEGMNLRGTDLVVLSACDTGIGSIRNGEGVFGLKRSFVLAGAQTLVLSLWKVPDQTTRKLMGRFYALWTSGLSKSEALRKARLEIMETESNPFYWAAFQLVGNPQ